MQIKPIQLRNAAAVASMAAPVGYLILRHVQWEKKPDSKIRMLIHQGTFWACTTAALKVLHDAVRDPVFLRKLSKHPAAVYQLLAPRLLVAGTLLVGGFEGGRKLAQLILPKKSVPATSPTRRVYTPPHLITPKNAF